MTITAVLSASCVQREIHIEIEIEIRRGIGMNVHSNLVDVNYHILSNNHHVISIIQCFQLYLPNIYTGIHDCISYKSYCAQTIRLMLHPSYDISLYTGPCRYISIFRMSHLARWPTGGSIQRLCAGLQAWLSRRSCRRSRARLTRRLGAGRIAW